MTERQIESVQVEVRVNEVVLVLSDGERSGSIQFNLENALLLADSLERAVRHVEQAAMGQQG